METRVHPAAGVDDKRNVRIEVFPERDGNYFYTDILDSRLWIVRMKVFPERDGNGSKISSLQIGKNVMSE